MVVVMEVVIGGGSGGGGTKTSARYCYLGGAGARHVPLVGGQAKLARDARYPVRRGCLGERARRFHTQHRRKGVPHQPGPEPEPGALLRRGPLADGVAPHR